MNKLAQKNIDKAMVAFETGFTTKSAKTQALRHLNLAYESTVHDLRKFVLDIDFEIRNNHPLLNEFYFSLPFDLSGWREKHGKNAIELFPESVDVVANINELVELRTAIKEAEIVKVEVKTEHPMIKKVEKTIQEWMEMKKTQFERGIQLNELLGGLNVSANSHYVTNSHGTHFIRTFYYLNHKLTSLNMIIAIFEQIQRQKEATTA